MPNKPSEHNLTDVTQVGSYYVFCWNGEWCIEFPEPAGTLGGFKTKQEAVQWIVNNGEDDDQTK